MRWRPAHLALILFQALWLNVIVPGHTRGVIALPGSGAPTCCDDAPPSCHPDAGRHRAPPARQSDPSNCAICNFAARLSTPPVIDLRLTIFERLESVSPRVIAECVPADPISTYQGRGPPVVM